MTRTVLTLTALTFSLCGIGVCPATAAELSGGQQAVAAATKSNQYAFLFFYRGNDAATQGMHKTVQSALSGRTDAVLVPVRLDDASESALIERFDATRTPMPATFVLAPNGAITSVFPQRVTSQQLTTAIVSQGQATCIKALQDQKIVLLCAHPEGNPSIPAGVQQFEADPHFKDRTQVVSLRANDPAEAKFLNQLRIRTDQPTAIVAFMAPPGVMLGRYNANVTHTILAQKLASAGKCCDDPSCKHHQSAGSKPSSRR